ncbi:peptidoglycan DD-metalloendopeptidase family protein [Azoarcus sp. TTM-91]|uniref:peptidoglycan DD-metalloendopeptidase family protein n=1 Tax=Azoarcus sp. TTM-91 TaxID=2691581 RepID=UPI00145E9A45|nr:peptidoglycan DD-metalloendopeptidase family protein [Azoarcus sp. TTM-91]NMG33136.1 peptidoglycan DD-metalloendopeptidase family protein [Azoarcus sp. TTM-91]
MNDSVLKYKKISLAGLVLVLGVLSGCASRVSAPIRDGNGVSPPPAATQVERQGIHVVKQGETLLGISRQYGQSVRDLVAWNNLANPNQIHVGQELRVSPSVEPSGGAVATAIPVSPEPVIVSPVTSSSGETGGAAIKQAPLGGKQPYSDEAWNRTQPKPAAPVEGPSMPAQPTADGSKDIAGDGDWLWPAKGKVLAGFSEATNKGLDIAGNPGDPVIASGAGKVVYSGSGLRGYGKLVIIKHDANYLTAYAHNQQLLVKEGDSVTKGQKIAELGSTDTDRPKLHFEIRKQGRPVDPMKYLPPR